ncbi:Listeria-Bacteroides repeat domain [Bacteroidales bacterium Barb4]|nr:Listeria-Bacteroides repeat domain [Bacteroidales bacterium Barb4]
MKGDTEMQAHFFVNSYRVSLSAENGTITSGNDTYTYGREIVAEAAADEGHHFVAWTDEAGDWLSAENPITFTVKGNTVMRAHFAPNSCLVSLSAVDGRITSGDGTYTYGTEVTAAADTDKKGYHLVKWTNAAGDSLSAENPYTFPVKGDTEMQAYFSNIYQVNLFAAEHGRITSGGGTYTHGAGAVAVATADYGYHLVRWENAAGDSLSADNPYRFAVKEDVKLTAVFSEARMLVTAEAAAGGRVTGGGYYDYGSQVTLTAFPDSGYRFARWTAGEKLTVQVGNADSYSFLLIRTAFDSYRANFVREGGEKGEGGGESNGGEGNGGSQGNEFLPSDREAGAYHAEGVLHLVHLDGYFISIDTMTGERVLQFMADGDDAEYATALPAGVYILNAAKGEERIVARKFVVK